VDRLLLRPGEVADLLGIGRSKVYALLAAKDLPSVRVGRSVRIPAQARARWVASHSAETSLAKPPGGD